MPMSFYNAPDYTAHGLFRPELDVLERLPFWAPAAVALVVAAMLVLARLRSRLPSPCIPGGSASPEGTLGHFRQVKAELKGRRGEAAVVGLDGLAARLRAGPAAACDGWRLDVAWRPLTAAAAGSRTLRSAHLRLVQRVRWRAGTG